MKVTNHKLHLIITVCSLGIWGIVWLIVIALNALHNRGFKAKLEIDELEKQLTDKATAEKTAKAMAEEAAEVAEATRRKALQKEIDHKSLALAAILDNADPEDLTEVEVSEIARIEEKLSELTEAVDKDTEMKANLKAGYVYVISNVGSFGPNIVKIGVTRVANPVDRVTNLGKAEVPFKFDIHMLHYSEAAFEVETKLHNAFNDRRVNRANLKKEFFYATPEEVRDEVLKLDGLVIKFDLEFENTEYQRSEEIRKKEELTSPDKKRGRRAAY